MVSNEARFGAKQSNDEENVALCFCRDLVEEDISGGRSPPLPDLTDEEWNLLLSAPAFQMSTSMHYTVKVRRRRTSSNAASSVSGASGGSQGGTRGPVDRECLDAAGSSDDSSDESRNDAASDDAASDMGDASEVPRVRQRVLVPRQIL